MRSGPIWVVGYGNPLRGDDGVGQEVAKALWLQRDTVGALAGATITWALQLLPEMALDVSGSGVAVFIDAAHDGRAPGSVALQLLSQSPEVGDAKWAIAGGCWEDFTPANLLALAHCLFGTAPLGVVVSVGVGRLDLGKALSPEVQAAVPRAAAAVRLAIASVPERSNAVLSSGVQGQGRYTRTPRPHQTGPAHA